MRVVKWPGLARDRLLPPNDSLRAMGHPLLDEISGSDDLGRLLSHWLFGATPEIFGTRGDWIEWRCQLADGLGVDDHGVLLVGSAAFGISLNPHNSFRPFGPHSDIDVAVLSVHHFDIAWFEMRAMRERGWFSLPQRVKNELKRFAPNYVFAGSIATDKLIGRLSFGEAWVEALGEMTATEPTTDRTIKVRLYRDAEALRAYQMRGLRDARDALVAQGGSGLD